jgi:hypothetical protein
MAVIVPGGMYGPLSSGDSAQPTPITLIASIVSGNVTIYSIIYFQVNC